MMRNNNLQNPSPEAIKKQLETEELHGQIGRSAISRLMHPFKTFQVAGRLMKGEYDPTLPAQSAARREIRLRSDPFADNKPIEPGVDDELIALANLPDDSFERDGVDMIAKERTKRIRNRDLKARAREPRVDPFA